MLQNGAPRVTSLVMYDQNTVPNCVAVLNLQLNSKVGYQLLYFITADNVIYLQTQEFYGFFSELRGVMDWHKMGTILWEN